MQKPRNVLGCWMSGEAVFRFKWQLLLIWKVFMSDKKKWSEYLTKRLLPNFWDSFITSKISKHILVGRFLYLRNASSTPLIIERLYISSIHLFSNEARQAEEGKHCRQRLNWFSILNHWFHWISIDTIFNSCFVSSLKAISDTTRMKTFLLRFPFQFAFVSLIERFRHFIANFFASNSLTRFMLQSTCQLN